MLSDNLYLSSYNKSEHDIATEFYLPSMRIATHYDRVSGYFGSTIYIIAWDALKEFINNNGKMRIVCSPYVSKEDAIALSEGYSARNDFILSQSIEREVKSMFESESLLAPSRLLAYLVSEGIIDIKIAVPDGGEAASTKRMFHDKVGVFSDIRGNAVGFRGSMNETFQGLSSDGNIESIDVFPSWLDERDKQRVDDAREFFNKLWNHALPGVVVYNFPVAAREIIKQKAFDAEWEELLKEIQVTQSFSEKWRPNHQINGKKPRKHQVDALEKWMDKGRRGILEHATGSGKTFTAMCAINSALEKDEVAMILVPSRDLLRQWYRELQETLTDREVFYLLCGDDNNEWKRNNLLNTWTSKTKDFRRVVIATMDTASSSDFISKVSQGEHIFLIADEVHRVGSQNRRKVLDLQTGARLGLSATPYRYGDPEGTSVLLSYFEGVVPPPYTLNDAINDGVLTKYFYHPQKISLSAEEQNDWNSITDEIRKLLARLNVASDSEIDINANPRLKLLLINRARIIKNAQAKIPLVSTLLEKYYHEGDKWLIYCDNIKQLKAVLDNALDSGIDAYEYYAGMRGDRETTLSYFSSNGGILVSIKCLDEGVDIPETTHALILASSQNPREFIQRRGRILRRAPNKYYAHLFDAITVPRIDGEESEKSLSIIVGELARAIQFGESAVNPACVTDLKNIAIDFQIEYEDLSKRGFEEDDD